MYRISTCTNLTEGLKEIFPQLHILFTRKKLDDGSLTLSTALPTTTEHGYSNTNLCYYRLVNMLLAPLVTHSLSVTISNVTTVKSIGTQHICYCASKKVLLLSNTIPYLMEHL